ncbi:hypothetical protein MAR_015974 [Mya arenaria]|uniref:Uncharacterized protein n=1 Tax=Mya arenaria TaxID=6604 RepID=A0ABY7FIJ0_MYAAR|nr:hypothetical protein MAR_015974 [Mya arenaria]
MCVAMKTTSIAENNVCCFGNETLHLTSLYSSNFVPLILCSFKATVARRKCCSDNSRLINRLCLSPEGCVQGSGALASTKQVSERWPTTKQGIPRS